MNTKTTPLFSVVIPLYNKENSIIKTIDSVLKQEHLNYEILVVNDGSTDTSLKALQGLKSPRIKIVTQGNLGVSVARNRGIAEAKGRYIAFLDADDLWTPEHLADLEALITAYPGCSLYSSAHAVIRDHKVYYKRQPSTKVFVSDADGFFEEYAKSFSLVNSSTACLPKETLDQIGGFPINVAKGEDVIVWIKASLINGIAYSNNVCTYVNQDAENRSDKNNSGEIPFFIIWLDNELRKGRIASLTALKAQRFLHRAIIFNAAGCSLRGEQETVKTYRKLFTGRSLTLSISLTLLLFAPTGLLALLKRRRHNTHKAFKDGVYS